MAGFSARRATLRATLAVRLTTVFGSRVADCVQTFALFSTSSTSIIAGTHQARAERRNPRILAHLARLHR